MAYHVKRLKKGTSKSASIIEEKLYELLNSTTNEVERIIIILCGFFGLREGEVVHFRKDWIHYNDTEAKHYKFPHIEIPEAGTIECHCVDCMLREYRRFKDDGEKHKKEWNLKIQKRFYRLKNQIVKDSKGKKVSRLDKIFENHKLVPYWKPKTTEGSGKVGTFDTSLFEPLVDFYNKHETIGLSRIQVWGRVKKLGEKIHLDKKLFPHALRASHSTILSRRGVNIFSIKTNMRHRDIKTTDKYVNSQAEQSLKDIKSVSK